MSNIPKGEEINMPPKKKSPVCEIVFGNLRIPVYEASRGKEIIDGIFLIGTGTEGKGEVNRRRKGGGRKRGKRADKARRAEKAKELAGKGMKKAEIARKLKVTPITVARDLKETK